MSAADLQFDAETHIYRFNGVEIPSVTTVIKAAGLMGDTTHWTEHGRTRGSYVAEATALDDLGDLDWDTLDPELKPYCEQWRAFRKESGFVHLPDGVEKRVCDPIYRYAGTLDRLGMMGGKLTLIDIKLGDPARWHGVQVSAYRRACKNTAQLINVYLSPENYRVVSRHERNDEAVFLAALAIYNWKIQNGV